MNTAQFTKYYSEYTATPEYQSLIAKYQDLFNYISENVGSNIDSFYKLFAIYDTLKTHVRNINNSERNDC